MKTSPASPLKSAAEEIDVLRILFRSVLKAYTSRIEADIANLQTAAKGEAKDKDPSSGKIRDARDMIALVRTLKVTPEKGRRRDLKKIEATLEDLEDIVKRWQP
jgi:hypothetical protein